MTVFTDNLRIPHLDQNVYQPEVPENTAKNIIDAIFSGQVDVDMLIDDNYTFTQVDNATGVEIWQNGLIKMVDTTTPLTDARDIILPTNKRTYILVNGTSQSLTFKCSGQLGVGLSSGQNMYAICNGTDIERLQFVASGAGTDLGTLNDVTAGYGTTGQLLTTNGVNHFDYTDFDFINLEDVDAASYQAGDAGKGVIVNQAENGLDFAILNFINLDDVDETSYQVGDAGKAVIVNQGENGLEFGAAGITLEGGNEITDEAGVAYGTIFTGDAAVNFSTDATTGTGLMYGTQGLVGINTNIEFFKVDPDTNQTQLLGASSVVTHADDSTTTLNNPEYMAQNAQRTADIALKNTLDINALLDTLSKAVTLTHDGTTAAFTFNLT